MWESRLQDIDEKYGKCVLLKKNKMKREKLSDVPMEEKRERIWQYQRDRRQRKKELGLLAEHQKLAEEEML